MVVCKCWFMECTFFPLHVIVMSFANNWVFIGGLRLMVISLIPIKNRVVLITDPCRTPFLIITGCNKVPFTLTWMDLFDRKLVMKDNILSFTFNCMGEFAILDFQIMSKAFSISKAAMYSTLRKASQMLVSKFVKMSIVER